MKSKRKSKVATQREIVKARLLAGARLTVWGCIRAYGFNTLAQRVYELRASGLAVLSMKVPNSRPSKSGRDCGGTFCATGTQRTRQQNECRHHG